MALKFLHLTYKKIESGSKQNIGKRKNRRDCDVEKWDRHSAGDGVVISGV